MPERPASRLKQLPAQSLGLPLNDLGLCRRAYHCVHSLGTVGGLLQAREDELMARRNFGRACLIDIRQRLTCFVMGGLGVAEDDPRGANGASSHPSVPAVWEAPPQPRPMREVLEEILEFLGRGDQLPIERAN